MYSLALLKADPLKAASIAEIWELREGCHLSLILENASAWIVY